MQVYCSNDNEDIDDYHKIDIDDVAVYRDIINKLKSIGFVYVGHGMFRTVYMRGNVVVKIPHDISGQIDNRTEARAWKIYRDKATSLGIFLAPCRLMSNGCLMMVTVDTNVGKMNLPYWTNIVDSYQVGIYKNRVVAYDYALDIIEREQWENEWRTYTDFFHNVRLSYLNNIANKI